MDDIAIIDRIIEEVNTIFPKKCPCCGKIFNDFRDFIMNTEIPNHVPDENFMVVHLSDIYDVLAFRNCKCNTTMSIPCAIDKNFKKQLVEIIEERAQKLGIKPEKMAGIMRDLIIKRAKEK
ncbi:MAG: hypothetical protein N3C60_04835 [Calditerrivibrio sp.]|nr:hypothetical protein [Calditerrivibrio sp.]